MRKSILIILVYVPFIVFGQSHSWDGNGIKPNEKIHYLNVFVNIIYDVHSDINNNFDNPNLFWPTITDPDSEGVNTAAIPTYLLDWMDTVYVPGQLHGTCTRLYGESSFDTLQITGDFVVVNIKESTILSHGPFHYNTIDNVAMEMLSQSTSFTLFGHHNLADFNAKNVLIRNITLNYGGLDPGSGGGGRNTIQCVGDGDLSTNPTCIVTHEISHGLFGTNAFHTSGGNHRYPDFTVMSFLNVQGGYGLMGAAHSGLVGCNGYERWRMHWKHPQSVDYISARNAANTQSVVSDITREDGNKTFLLRDFVTYGDVVRIKLPYKDSVTSSNQYIWLENHQVGSNGKLDFLQYSNITHYAYCRPQGAAGIYAYYQVGRDILEGTISEVWDSYDRDNLRIIPAEGYYDFELLTDTYNPDCVCYVPVTYAYRRGLPNPLCGGQDQEFQLFPLETDNVLYLSRELEPWRKVIDNQNYDCLPFLGDTMDAFRTHTKINMGTNPSTNNVKTYHSNNQNPSNIISAKNPEKNVQTTYLTGLSIEMTPVQGTGNILVQVRWDDYNITNDTRWTGKIALKDTAILTMGNTITLAQNRTVAQPTRDPETGLFAGRTRWTCENGSYFRQDSTSTLILTENSSLTFEGGSRYELSKGARVEIHAGCSMTVRPGANVCLKGIVEVDSGGVFNLYDTAKMGNLSRLIVRPGGKLILDGGTLTSACPGELWQGVEVVGDPAKRQIPQWQGTVELKNGAVIENAFCGIHTGYHGNAAYATTGGIITADSAFFINNRRAVAFLSYTNHSPAGTIMDNQSSFSRCVFTVDNNNLFSQNSTDFLDHVTMWEVRGVKFKGCTFTNQTNERHQRRHAIYADDAGFKIDTYCKSPTNIFLDCECPEALSTYNTFSGFSTAVEVLTTGVQHAVQINHALFSNNYTAVKIDGNHFASVTRCEFDLDQVPVQSLSNRGLDLRTCTGYLVEENTFSRSIYSNPTLFASTGIYVDNSGNSDNLLHRNTFEKLGYGIRVNGANGDSRAGLQATCNDFIHNKYDIYMSNGSSMKKNQGESSKGADNSFSNTQTSSFRNAGPQYITYYYSNGGNHAPYNETQTYVTLNSSATANPCSSTLCNDGWVQPRLADFQSDMDTYTDSTQPLSDIYYTAVRTLMSDTVLDLNELEMWHTVAQPISDPYSLTETRFMEGYAEIFAENAETDAEMANYAEFHALKLALRGDNADNDNNDNTDNNNSQNSPKINWYSLTPAQIAQLQTIAERNTGRASVMAKGVLCFFHGICYEDEWDNVGAGAGAGAHAGAPQQGDDTTGTRAKHISTDNPGDATLSVYPNPTDDILFVELRGGAEIANVALYDLQGRIVTGVFDTSQRGGTATINVKSIPAGVYVLRVTDVDGKEYHRKIVRK